MNTSVLLSLAKRDFADAIILACLIERGDVRVTIPELLASYAILKKWADDFAVKRNKYEKNGETQKADGCLSVEIILKSYMIDYEREWFKKVEYHILEYMRGKKITGFDAEELETAKVFVDVTERLENLEFKDWKQFLPQE